MLPPVSDWVLSTWYQALNWVSQPQTEMLTKKKTLKKSIFLALVYRSHQEVCIATLVKKQQADTLYVIFFLRLTKLWIVIQKMFMLLVYLGFISKYIFYPAHCIGQLGLYIFTSKGRSSGIFSPMDLKC